MDLNLYSVISQEQCFKDKRLLFRESCKRSSVSGVVSSGHEQTFGILIINSGWHFQTNHMDHQFNPAVSTIIVKAHSHDS